MTKSEFYGSVLQALREVRKESREKFNQACEALDLFEADLQAEEIQRYAKTIELIKKRRRHEQTEI